MIRVTPGREPMNIPEISNDIKQNVRSENVTRAQTEDRVTPDQGSVRTTPAAASKQEGANSNSSGEQHFDKEHLDSIIKEAQEHLEQQDINLKFNVLEEGETVQVEIVDSDGKTIRKIPEDDLLKLSKSLKNLERGFLDKIS